MKREFTYNLITKTENGAIKAYNARRFGYGCNAGRKSFYATEQAARKALEGDMRWAKKNNETIYSWEVWQNSRCIEKMA